MPTDHNADLELAILRQLQAGRITQADASELLSMLTTQDAPQASPGAPQRAGVIHSYSRVSTAEQADNMTQETHRQQAASFAVFLQTKHPELRTGVYFFDPGVSAFKVPLISRPEGQRLHKMLRAGDHVVFVALNRAFRSTRDFLATYELWRRMGVTITFLDIGMTLDSATGRMFATIMAAVAEWDSARKSEVRICNNKLAREQGRKLGRETPRGKQTVRHKGRILLIPDRQKHAIARLIWVLHEQRKLSFEKISDRLEALLAKREGRAVVAPWNGREWNRGRCHKWFQDYRAGKFKRA